MSLVEFELKATRRVRTTYGTAKNVTRPVVLQPVQAHMEAVTDSSSNGNENDDSDSDDDGGKRRKLKQTELSFTNKRPHQALSRLTTLNQRPRSSPTGDKAEKKKKEQTYLNFGQRPLVPQPCTDCGLLYQRDGAEDEKRHHKYHQSWLQRHSKLLEWRVGDQTGVVCIDTQHAKPSTLRRALKILDFVNQQLGAIEVTAEDMAKRQRKIFLYIAPANNRVQGCVLAEAIVSASRVITFDKDGVVRCGKGEDGAADCGISRIWVDVQARRSGIASKMLDGVCKRFFYGKPIGMDRLAFTQPTSDGQALAARVFKRDDFLVYSENS